jgi:hypothetical protein
MPPSSSLGSIAAAPWVRTTTQRCHKPPNPQVSSAPPLLLVTCTGGLQGGGTPAGDEDGWEGIGDERRGGYRGGQEDGSAEWGGQHDHEVYDGNGRAVLMEFVFLVVGAIRQGRKKRLFWLRDGVVALLCVVTVVPPVGSWPIGPICSSALCV